MNTFNENSIKAISPIFVPENGGKIKIFATELNHLSNISVDGQNLPYETLSATEILVNIPTLKPGIKNIIFTNLDNESFTKEKSFISINNVKIDYIKDPNSPYKTTFADTNLILNLNKNGGQIEVVGSGLRHAQSIYIDGNKINNFEILSDKNLIINFTKFDSGLKNNLLIEDVSGQKTIFPVNIKIQNQPPQISNISPSFKLASEAFLNITINGLNFDSSSLEVKIGEETQNIISKNPTTITIQYFSEEPGTKDVTVITESGKAILRNAISVFSSPFLTSISKRSISQNGEPAIQIQGNNLNQFTKIELSSLNGDNKIELPIIGKTNTLIRFSIPAIQNSGYKNLILSYPLSNNNLFEVVEFGILEVITNPIISSIYPDTINPQSESKITVYGENLLNAGNVFITQNDFSETYFTPYSNFSGELIVPPVISGAGTVNVEFQSIAESQSTQTAVQASYTQPSPIVNGVNPSTAPSLDIQYVYPFNDSSSFYVNRTYGQIYGKNFGSSPAVRINGQNVNINSFSNYGDYGSVIDLIYPTGITGSANVQVVSFGQTGTLENAIFFSNRPLLEKIYPNYSPSGGGQFVTIEGKGLSGARVFIQQGYFDWREMLNVKYVSNNKLTFLTAPGSGGCLGEYMGSCVQPNYPAGLKSIKLQGEGGTVYASGLDYLMEPQFGSIYQDNFTLYGPVPIDSVIISGLTWNPYDEIPDEQGGALKSPINAKINGVKLTIQEQNPSGAVAKIPYQKYELIAKNTVLTNITPIYTTIQQVYYSGDYNYDFEGEEAYVNSLFNEKARFMSGVAKTIKTGLSGTFSSPSENQSFDQKSTNLINSFSLSGFANFFSIKNDTAFKSIINSGLLKFYPLFSYASGIHFAHPLDVSGGKSFTGDNQDFYNESYPFNFIYRTGNFDAFESGTLAPYTGTIETFSGYSGTPVVSGVLSNSALSGAKFINTLEYYNSNPVFTTEDMGFKLWYHDGSTNNNFLNDDWNKIRHNYGAIFSNLETLNFCKKNIVTMANPGTSNTLQLNLPNNAKIGTLVQVNTESIGTNSKNIISGDGINAITLSGSMDRSPFTFLKTKYGWANIFRGDYLKYAENSTSQQTINSRSNIPSSWVLSPNTGEFLFSWIKFNDPFNYLGNYTSNPNSVGSSGSLSIENVVDSTEYDNGIFYTDLSNQRYINQRTNSEYSDVIQINSGIETIVNELPVSIMPFIPPSIKAVAAISNNGSTNPKMFGPNNYSLTASGVYTGGYRITVSGFFRKTIGISEVFLNSTKVAQFDSSLFGGTPPYGGTSQETLTFDAPTNLEIGNYDITIENKLGVSTLKNAFSIIDIPDLVGSIFITPQSAVSAPTPQQPPVYPRSIDLNQDNIPDSWDNLYFPQNLNFDTFTITGWTAAGNTYSSPNAIYYSSPSQSTSTHSIYLESGIQAGSAGQNRIECRDGRCILTLAPKTSIVPIGATYPPIGGLTFIECYGGGEGVPTPWGKNWSYQQPQIIYTTGSVNPNFKSSINHHVVDSDNDGQNNIREFVFKTDPTSSSSRYFISYNSSPSTFDFFVPTTKDRRYIVESGNLINWTRMSTITGDGKTYTFSVPKVGSVFFRARVEVIHYPPVASKIEPNYSNLGATTSIKISGSGFSTIKNLTVDSVTASNFYVPSDNILFFETPSFNTLGSRNISITNASGTRIVGQINYLNPPIITSINPDKFGPNGGNITINGSQFNNPLKVTINRNNSQTQLAILSSTNNSINCTIPKVNEAGEYTLFVSAAGGNTGRQIRIFGQPNILSVSPSAGLASLQNNIKITGSNFVSGHTKLFMENAALNYVALTPSNISETSIDATLPTSAVTGFRKIKVETFDQYSTELNNAFRYVFAPTISSIKPSTGILHGTQNVNISGFNFDENTKAFIDGKEIINPILISSSLISGKTPSGISVGRKNVTISGYNTTSVLNNGYRYANAPIITSVNPSCIRTGTTQQIIVSGQNLLNSNLTRLNIGGSNISISNINASETELIANVSASNSAGYYNFYIETEAGTERTPSSYIIYAARPRIDSVNPSWSNQNGGQNITIYGGNFYCQPSLKVGGISVPIISSTNDNISFITPSNTAGLKTIEVSNAGGTGTNTIMYLERPVITSLSPSVGTTAGGNFVDISGSGLHVIPYASLAEVFIGGIKAQHISSSNTRLRVIAPASTPGFKNVTVNHSGGSFTLNGGYRYIGNMSITSFSPNAGPLAGGNKFTIIGSDIPTNSVVKFGTGTATLTSISETAIEGIVPPNSTIGKITATVSGGGLPALSYQYAYLGAPIIQSIYPTVGPANANLTFIITGSRFTLPGENVNYNSSFKIGNQQLLISNISEKSITANSTTPISGVFNVTYSNNGGTGTIINGYTGINYTPNYTMPPVIGSTGQFVTSSVNTLYITYQP